MAILIGALALRIAEVQGTSYRPINDAGSYLTLASYIARTGDYSLRRTPGSGAGGTRGPSAYFAPGFPYFLGLVDIIDGHETRRDGAIHPARISQAVLGTITVALIGLVALELFGETAGLIALVLAAIYPVLIELSATIVAENLLTALILAAVYTGLRVRRARNGRTRLAWVAGTGVLAGLATLTHMNGVLILIPLIPAVWTGRPRLKLGSLAAPAVLIAVTALTILPWTIRNAIVMHHFIPVSDETGITLVGTYNVASALQHATAIQVADLLRHSGRAQPDPRVPHADRAADRLSPGEPGAPLHLRPPVLAVRRRVPQHAADARGQGCIRLAGLGLGDLDLDEHRLAGHRQLLDPVRAGVSRRVDQAGANGAEMGVGGTAPARAQRRARQRRDAALPGADRPVPDPAGVGRAGDARGPATRCASRR